MSLLRKLSFILWYWRDPPWDTGITPPEVYAFLETHPPGRALDLGCGTGTNAITLAKHNWQVTGVDFVPAAIRKAKRKAAQAGVRVDFRVGDVTRLKGISGPFDLILDIGCYHGLSERGKADYRLQIFHLLRAGGTFLLYVFFRESPAAPGPGVVEADLEAFSPPLDLIARADGFERKTRPSAWLTFQKPGP